MDLVVRPGPGVPGGLVVPAGLLEERFARASGPGGQGVNTTDSRAQLGFDVAGFEGFTAAQRRRVLAALENRLVDGWLWVDAAEERSQFRNRKLARERMADQLRAALAPPPPPRRATKPTKGSVQRRLAAKKRRAEIKQGRGRVNPARD